MRVANLILVCLFSFCNIAEEVKPPETSSLDAGIASVLPRPDEDRWLKIPWMLDFAAARAEANEKGKPIFLWMMDGHPLGCT